MRTYRQLTQEQRYQIYALKKTKHSLAEIATVIVSASVIKVRKTPE
jgi:IS30 family transposase